MDGGVVRRLPAWAEPPSSPAGNAYSLAGLSRMAELKRRSSSGRCPALAPCSTGCPEAPHALEELLSGEHPRRIGGERPQQCELLGREIERLAAQSHVPRHRIDFEGTDPQPSRPRPPAGAPEQRADPRAELVVTERLTYCAYFF
jgi:hypothetical protein